LPDPAPGGSEFAQYNLRILRPLADYVRAQHGAEALKKVAAAGRVLADDLDGKSHWVPIEQFESLLAAARALFPDDETFKKACVYRLAEAYGPMRYVLWATSPATVYRQAIRTYNLVSTDCHPRIISSDRTALDVRFERSVPISRISCLSRQAQTASLPTLWGLPPAHLREEGCIAHGDEACVYHLRWFDAKRWLPIAMGLAIGAGLAAWLAGTRHMNAVGAVALTLLGLAIGYIYELHRTGSANVAVGNEINNALKLLAEEEADARREILALHQRQRDWSRMLEEDAAERTSAFQDVVDRIRATQFERDTTLRGFSHDLKNPLAVLRANTDYLRESNPRPDVKDIVKDFDQVIDQMQRLLDDLVTVASNQTTFMQITPQKIEVATVTERLRRRLRALVHGRDIRASVFRTREAPEAISTDQILLDRVIDNILTNAAKYTERGSIVIELDGTPQSLIIKVSDTGRGIAPEDLEKTFRPGGSDRQMRATFSHGVGLSVVVQLLGQVGGRLEVMSKPAHGTTFWIHFPLDVPKRSDPPRAGREKKLEAYGEVLDRVVTIRRMKSA